MRLQKIHPATDLFCHPFALLSRTHCGDGWSRRVVGGGTVCPSCWGEIPVQLMGVKGLFPPEKWDAFSCSLHICLRHLVSPALGVFLQNWGIIRSGRRMCMGWSASTAVHLYPAAVASLALSLRLSCIPRLRLCLVQQQRKCLQKHRCPDAAGGCDRYSHCCGMSTQQCCAVCAIIVLCCKLEATESRARQRPFCNSPPGMCTHLQWCRMCTMGMAGSFCCEDDDRIPPLDFTSVSHTLSEIAQQWLTFKLPALKKPSKGMRREYVNFQGKLCWKIKGWYGGRLQAGPDSHGNSYDLSKGSSHQVLLWGSHCASPLWAVRAVGLPAQCCTDSSATASSNRYVWSEGKKSKAQHEFALPLGYVGYWIQEQVLVTQHKQPTCEYVTVMLWHAQQPIKMPTLLILLNCFSLW